MLRLKCLTYQRVPFLLGIYPSYGPVQLENLVSEAGPRRRRKPFYSISNLDSRSGGGTQGDRSTMEY